MQSFGKFSPDSATLNVALAAEASGVLPGRTGYVPIPSMVVASAPLATAGRGAYMARTPTNSVAVFAGTATKLYKYASMSAWTDLSKVGGYAMATDDLWQFVQYGPNVYATQISNPLQTCDAAAGIIFADAAGSPPKARYIAVVGDFLMLGNTDSNSREIRWSARNDPTIWARYTKDADSQTFPDGGDVMGIAGFEQGGLVFQTDGVRQMTVRQDAAIMEFHRLEAAQGTLAPYSLITRQGGCFYYATNGFRQISADGGSQGIGVGWVDDWFLAHSSVSTRPKAVIGSIGPTSSRVFWLFADPVNAASSILDHVLCFDPSMVDSDYGPWTHAPLQASYIFSAATFGTTLEGLGAAGLGYTMETVPYSLDADIWKGGAPRIAGFDAAFKMNFFSGPAMAAMLSTGLFSPVPGSRGFVNGFRLVSDAAAATGRIFTAERQQSVEVPSAPGTLTDQGIIYRRASGRHIRVEVTIPAGAAWTKASGVSFDDDAGLITSDGAR
jgi:hypothetical protein